MKSRNSTFKMNLNSKYSVYNPNEKEEIIHKGYRNSSDEDENKENYVKDNNNYDYNIKMTRNTVSKDKGLCSNLIKKLLSSDKIDIKDNKKQPTLSRQNTNDVSPTCSDNDLSKRGRQSNSDRNNKLQIAKLQNKEKDLMYIPCTNCHNLVHMDEIGKIKILM
jgi:hypothetical protein